MKALACILLLCACQTNPDAGMVAARMTGQHHYLSFVKDGHRDSAAVFRFQGENWIYYAPIGSWNIHQSDPQTVFYPSLVQPVLCEPKNEDVYLANGCLPLALAEQRAKGGHVALVGHHAERKTP